MLWHVCGNKFYYILRSDAVSHVPSYHQRCELQVTQTSEAMSILTGQLQQLQLANQQSRSDNGQLQSERDNSKHKVTELEGIIQTMSGEITQLTDKLNQSRKLQDTVRQ
mgnify:CR=1 FL=1